MERRLFRVSLQKESGGYSCGNYYVIAKDFNQAAIKAKDAYIHEQETKALITEDGSLKEGSGCKVSAIEFITDNLLL
jgi:hypothetical protein